MACKLYLNKAGFVVFFPRKRKKKKKSKFQDFPGSLVLRLQGAQVRTVLGN